MRKYQGDSISFDRNVRIDQFGRRVSFYKELIQRPNHLILMGCSFVMGYGLSDDETLSFKINDLQDTYEAINFGHPGYGPGDVLSWIRNYNGLDGVSQESGIGIYVFIDQHISRMIGSISILDTWGQNLTATTVDSSGQVQLLGSFGRVNPFRTQLFNFLNKSSFLKLFKKDLPIITQSDYEKFAKIIGSIRDDYLSKFSGQKNFYFLIYPESGAHINLIALKKYLKKERISILDFSKEKRLILKDDNHPSRIMNSIMAEKIIKIIQ